MLQFKNSRVSMLFKTSYKREEKKKTTATRVCLSVDLLTMAARPSKSSMASYFWKKVSDEVKDKVNSVNMSYI